jgi:two-component system alkaline phosphatase synthesis response regulator PhoP
MARILLVEDNTQVGELVRRYLEKEGMEVFWARSGGEALGWVFEGERPDLVVLDRGLPDMEGLEVLKELRELDPLLPVLLLTGRADEDSRVEGLLEGADDYLGKPFSLKGAPRPHQGPPAPGGQGGEAALWPFGAGPGGPAGLFGGGAS